MGNLSERKTLSGSKIFLDAFSSLIGKDARRNNRQRTVAMTTGGLSSDVTRSGASSILGHTRARNSPLPNNSEKTFLKNSTNELE
ncbi:hypothetical protein TNIN_390511 [Trichonephila inaurata madagascariensis]|uniref:Uncharacterized protein n=1 Tax=Trichonephila inaurata madagascariensis TaxID=2747483 RepID=A0A8X6X2U2_9ARAC|nr:hypothetical protein TNIN_390511 [Trichonephila inaurata madagascariensis]